MMCGVCVCCVYITNKKRTSVRVLNNTIIQKSDWFAEILYIYFICECVRAKLYTYIYLINAQYMRQ